MVPATAAMASGGNRAAAGAGSCWDGMALKSMRKADANGVHCWATTYDVTDREDNNNNSNANRIDGHTGRRANEQRSW